MRAAWLLAIALAACAASRPAPTSPLAPRHPEQDATTVAERAERERFAAERARVADEYELTALELADAKRLLEEKRAAEAAEENERRARAVAAAEAAASRPTPKSRAKPIPVETMRRWCTWGWRESIDGTKVQVYRHGSTLRPGIDAEIRPGVEPIVDCRPNTPPDVEAAVIEMVRPTDPTLRAYTIKSIVEGLRR